MPQSAAPEILKIQGLTSVPSIKQTYQECQASAYISSMTKADPTVKHCLASKLNRESQWSRKNSITKVAHETMESLPTIQIHDPHKKAEALVKKSKQSIKVTFQEKWTDHLKTLTVQGQFVRVWHTVEADIQWKSLLFQLPPRIMQFILNAIIDTLPTNCNLVRWKKRSNSKCDKCSNKETLMHVLNNCKDCLDKYTWRHNSILLHIKRFLSKDMPENVKIYLDIPGEFSGISTVPTDIAITNQKPDMVIVDSNGNVTLMELTVPFESNIVQASERKKQRYEHLISNIKDNGHNVELITIEIGSRGLICKENASKLLNLVKKVKKPNGKEFRLFKSDLTKVTVIASYIIFYSKFENQWVAPPYVNL